MPPYVLFGQACLVAFVVYGFEALPLDEKQYAGLMIFFGAAAFLLTPCRTRVRIRPALSLLLLLMWWLLSVAWGNSRWAWMVGTEATIPAVLALIAIATILPSERAFPALLIGCYLAIGCSLLALAVDPTVAVTNSDGSGGWRGSFGHRNLLALFLAFAIPTITTLERRRVRKIIWLSICLYLLVMSRSLTGRLALLMVAIVGAWLWTYRRMDGRKAVLFAKTSILVGAVALALTAWFMPVILPLLGRDVTLTGRTRIWKSVWSAVEARPWLGYGVGVWWAPSRPPAANISQAVGFRVYHSHNGLLDLLVRLGAIGAALYLAFFVQTLTGAWSRLRQRPDLNGWAVLVCVVICTTSVTEPTVLGPWLALLAYAQTLSRESAAHRSVPLP